MSDKNQGDKAERTADEIMRRQAMSEKLPDWFRALRNEYKAQAEKASPEAQVRLLRKFADIPERVMERAAERYMDTNQWWPIVATLRPYVEAALRESELVHDAAPEVPLDMQRREVMERLYEGDSGAYADALRLAVLFDRAGRPSAAQAIRDKARVINVSNESGQMA